MSDHPPVVGQVMGNVRATIYRNPENNEVDVLHRDDYYTFGKQRIVAAGLNKYIYNGKEKQGEFGRQAIIAQL